MFSVIDISQGSAASHVKQGGKFYSSSFFSWTRTSRVKELLQEALPLL